MIRTIDDLPEGVLGVEAVGTVTADDYETVLFPAIDAATEGGAKVRFLFLLGDEFDGYDTGAAVDDAKLGLHHWRSFERMALVTDHETYRLLAKTFGFLMPGSLKVFSTSDLADATAWVAA